MASQTAASTDMTASLTQLEEILGKKLSFAEAVDVEESDGCELGGQDGQDVQDDAKQEEQEQQWSVGMAADSGSRCAPAVQPRDRGEEGEKRVLVDYDCQDFVAGEMVGAKVDFVPWNTVQAYPSTFIGKRNSPRARPYFDAIFEYKHWDFFQLYNPKHPKNPPHLLVPTIQLVEFLRLINHELDTALTIPPHPNRRRFCIQFGHGGAPRPRYLARCTSIGDFEALSWPKIHPDDAMNFNQTPRKYQDEFASKIESMTNQAKTVDRKKRAEERARKRAADKRFTMDNARYYLGIQEGRFLMPPGAVFICIDVESLETAQRCVSEIGIAILDTAHIQGQYPEPDGSALWQHIQAHHLRTSEYSAMRNYRYVQGCPEAFEFGTSIFCQEKDLSATVLSIIGPYLYEDRPFLFVGHNVAADIRYLESIGIFISDFLSLMGTVDTQDLHQAWGKSNVARSLESVLSDLAMFNTNLHNAGNDAVYTLRAMIQLALEQERPLGFPTGDMAQMGTIDLV